MAFLDYTALALACMAFIPAVDGASFVVGGNADTQVVDNRQGSHFVRRESTGEPLVHKPMLSQKHTKEQELVPMGSTPKSRTDEKIDMRAEAARRQAMAAEKKRIEDLQEAVHNRAGVKEKTAEHTTAAARATETTEKAEKQQNDGAAVSGLPDIAFATNAWMIMDKEEHHANLLKLISARQKATGGSKHHSSPSIWCDKDYPIGHWNTSQCSSDGATDHQIIEMEEMCVEAAKLANATAGDGQFKYFKIPPEWGDLHPKGCFVFPCHWDPGHVCYWFNEQEEEPRFPWGAPVCHRPLFRNGTEDTNSGCPEGYDVIINENNCSEAASCKAYCRKPDNIVGVSYPMKNASQHDIYPEGCFIHKGDGCVYFNPIYGVNPPQHPQGIPLCNVTQITHFPEISLPWDVFW